MKPEEIRRLTAGETARSLRLADQYHMARQGDVARRLELEKHAMPFKIRRGVIGPMYERDCFRYHYWGPTFFAGACWYPHWHPWVKWSWHYHCSPHWDPRPIWCRPVVYVPAPVWVYWETPIWLPLPVVSCGTWVDVPPAPLPESRLDLQLIAVRFVDPGHPEENLGPRYRVWFRNNSRQPIAQPFDVTLFAGNDERLAAGLPQAGVRVASIETGETQSVDIRLPAGVYTMGRDAEGRAAPFRTLHVLVDASREIQEATEANNGARLASADILPVDPASFELDPVAVRHGGEVVVAGEGFGPRPGRVFVLVDGREFDGEILGWYDLGVRFAMPKLAAAAPIEADVVVIRSDGAAANPLKITITPN